MLRQFRICSVVNDIEMIWGTLIWKSGDFLIVLEDDYDNALQWKMPMEVRAAWKAGVPVLNMFHAHGWVVDRIVPPNRHNINYILDYHNMEVYDELELLLLDNGRCGLDPYYICELECEDFKTVLDTDWV